MKITRKLSYNGEDYSPNEGAELLRSVAVNDNDLNLNDYIESVWKIHDDAESWRKKVGKSLDEAWLDAELNCNAFYIASEYLENRRDSII